MYTVIIGNDTAIDYRYDMNILVLVLFFFYFWLC